jgi:hypothetical protein
MDNELRIVIICTAGLTIKVLIQHAFPLVPKLEGFCPKHAYQKNILVLGIHISSFRQAFEPQSSGFD